MTAKTMTVFFDTNALFKLYYSEVGSAAIADFMRRNSNHLQLIISDIALVEVHSALYRRLRMNECSEATIQQVLAALDHDAAFMQICTVDSVVQEQAKALIRTHGAKHSLRTLDSLQIASILVFNRITPIDIVLSSDTIFLEVMRQYLTALNPITDSLP